jgi:hypothetical protein
MLKSDGRESERKKGGKNAGILNWIMNNAVNSDCIAYGRRVHSCANEFYFYCTFLYIFISILQLSPSPPISISLYISIFLTIFSLRITDKKKYLKFKFILLFLTATEKH